jgi:Ca2+-binding RTX toxin-like protein
MTDGTVLADRDQSVDVQLERRQPRHRQSWRRRLHGGSSNDHSVGGPGPDRLDGGSGDDQRHTAGDGGVDEVVGGSGTDVCTVGPEDIVISGCEQVVPGRDRGGPVCCGYGRSAQPRRRTQVRLSWRVCRTTR